MSFKSAMRFMIDSLGDFVGTSDFIDERKLIHEKTNRLRITREQYNTYSGPDRLHRLTAEINNDVGEYHTKSTQSGHSKALINHDTGKGIELFFINEEDTTPSDITTFNRGHALVYIKGFKR